MSRIAIYIGRHLCTAPRPFKEAEALSAAGHEVVVSGLWFDDRLVERDRALLADCRWRFEPYADCRTGSIAGRVRWFVMRARSRIARQQFARIGTMTPDLLGYGATKLHSHARQTNADLTIFHSEAGLWSGVQLHRTGRRIGMDFEDWFSRDLPPESLVGRPVAALADLEAAALRFGPYVLATSHAMAAALARTYSAAKPSVIYNTFLRSEAPRVRPSVDPARVSLHWFSQSLGAGRGLETLAAALPALRCNWDLHLRGDDTAAFAKKFLHSLPEALRSRVHFAPTVPNAELPQRIAEHDVGLALDISSIESRNLTITNKLFQYMQAGLAIVASDTAGHREILSQVPAAGELFTAGDGVSLAQAINKLCCNPSRLGEAKRAARRAAETEFAHERLIPVYAELAARALTRE